ncbi:hypothetical protein MMC07_005128 [Pseudocyphellaria aurata]|nr:hypothetical protein [Pseudocyphellaria aurata]
MLPTRPGERLPSATTAVLKHAVTLNLKIGYGLENSPIEHHIEAIERLPFGTLDLMLAKADALQSLTLDGGASVMAALALDKFLAPAPWQKLKHIALKRLTINYKEFTTFCVLQQATLVNLAFDDVIMEGGSWRLALEVFRLELRLKAVRFCGILDREDGSHGFTSVEEDAMARHVLNRDEDLVELLQ